MRNLLAYGDFLNEKMGVPSMIPEMTEKISSLVVDAVVKISHENRTKDLRSVTLTDVISLTDVGTKEFPIDTLTIKIGLIINPRSVRNTVSSGGTFMPGTFKIKDGRCSFYTAVTVEISDIDQRDGLSDGVIVMISKQVDGTIQHELTHAYEEFKRKSSGHRGMETTRDFVYDMASKKITTDNPNILPSIRVFASLLYLAASYEVNARVSEMQAALAGIKDPHARERAMEQHKIWTMADTLEKFSADEMYANLVKSTGMSKENAENTLNHITDDLISYIDKTDDNIVGFIRKNDPEKAEDVVASVSKYKAEINKMRGVGAMRFLKHWEKKFKDVGKKFKRKLSKLITYED